MVDNNNDDNLCRHMEVREQASRTQQEDLENIQCMFSEILTNQNNEETSGNHDRGEENLNKETMRTNI